MKAGAALRALAAVVLGLAWAGVSLALDANTATQDELQTIHGVGPALSARIVEARRVRPFTDLDDLKTRVRGVGDANLRRMREAGLRVGPSGRVERVQTFVGQPVAQGARRRRPASAKTAADAARAGAAQAGAASAIVRR